MVARDTCCFLYSLASSSLQFKERKLVVLARSPFGLSVFCHRFHHNTDLMHKFLHRVLCTTGSVLQQNKIPK